MCGLILTAAIRIQPQLEREKISEKLQGNQVHKSSQPFSCFRNYEYLFRGDVVVC